MAPKVNLRIEYYPCSPNPRLRAQAFLLTGGAGGLSVRPLIVAVSNESHYLGILTEFVHDVDEEVRTIYGRQGSLME